MFSILIYTTKVTGGKPFVAGLRRLARKELQTWKLLRSQPLTIEHSQRPGIHVTFMLAGTGRFRAAMRDLRMVPEPSVVAVVNGATATDQVLGFLVGMLARRGTVLGIASVTIPLIGR